MAREHFRDKMSLRKRPVLIMNFVVCVSTERQVTHMKKGLTELVFILDRSGSMVWRVTRLVALTECSESRKRKRAKQM